MDDKTFLNYVSYSPVREYLDTLAQTSLKYQRVKDSFESPAKNSPKKTQLRTSSSFVKLYADYGRKSSPSPAKKLVPSRSMARSESTKTPTRIPKPTRAVSPAKSPIIESVFDYINKAVGRRSVTPVKNSSINGKNYEDLYYRL
jgi:hypothetical protein